MAIISASDYFNSFSGYEYDLLAVTSGWQGPNEMGQILSKLNNVSLAGAHVLDLGIGTGNLHTVFKRARVNQVTGVDFSKNMLDHAHAKQRASEVVLHDVTQGPLPFSSETFNLVTASGLFTYLENPVPLIAEMIRVTKEDGFIAVNFHHPESGDREVESLTMRALTSNLKNSDSFVTAYRHPIPAIELAFMRLEAATIANRLHPGGIIRPLTGIPIPMSTMLFTRDLNYRFPG